MPSERSTVEVAAVSKLSLVAVDVEQQVVAEGGLRKGLRGVAPVDVFDLRDAPAAAPDEGIGRAASGAPRRRSCRRERSLLNQGLRADRRREAAWSRREASGRARDRPVTRPGWTSAESSPTQPERARLARQTRARRRDRRSMRPESERRHKGGSAVLLPIMAGARRRPGGAILCDPTTVKQW